MKLTMRKCKTLAGRKCGNRFTALHICDRKSWDTLLRIGVQEIKTLKRLFDTTCYLFHILIAQTFLHTVLPYTWFVLFGAAKISSEKFSLNCSMAWQSLSWSASKTWTMKKQQLQHDETRAEKAWIETKQQTGNKFFRTLWSVSNSSVHVHTLVPIYPAASMTQCDTSKP